MVSSDYMLFALRWCQLSEYFFFCKQKTAYEMRISDWSSDVCSSDLRTITTFTFKTRLKLSFMLSDSSGERAEDMGGDLLEGVQGFFKIGRASCRERVCQYV